MPFPINCKKYSQDFLVSLKLTDRTNYTNPPPLATFLLSPFGRKNNVGEYLVELFWRPDLRFYIELPDTNGTVEGDPEGGNERRRQRLRRLSRQEDRWVRGDAVEKIQNHLKMTFNKARGGESVSSEGSEGTGDHGSNPVASRDKGGQGRALLPEPTTPSMYALFYQCVIAVRRTVVGPVGLAQTPLFACALISSLLLTIYISFFISEIASPLLLNIFSPTFMKCIA